MYFQRSEKTKMLQLRIEQVRSEVADKMDKVIFGGLLAEEEKEQNKVELAATVCLFAELDATSPTARENTHTNRHTSTPSHKHTNTQQTHSNVNTEAHQKTEQTAA